MWWVRRVGHAALVVFVSLAVGCAHSRGLAKWIGEGLCAVVDDDMDGSIHARKLAQITALGEKGRLALLEVARSPRGASPSCVYGYLLELGEEQRLLPILRAAVTDPHQEKRTRIVALQYLGNYGDRKSLGPALEAFGSDDYELVSAGLAALSAIDDPAVREVLRAALRDPKYAADVHNVIIAIGAQRDAVAVPLLAQIDADDAMLQHREDWLRSALAMSLTMIGTPESLSLLPGVLRKLQADRDRYGARIDVLRELERQRKRTTDPEQAARLGAAIREVEAIPDPFAKPN